MLEFLVTEFGPMAAHGDSVVVAVSGELDIVTSGEFDEHLTQAATVADVVILDLSRLDFIDTTCLGVIVSHSTELTGSGGSLLVAGARPEYAKALWITGLASWLPMYATVADALAAARPAQPSGSGQTSGAC
jgi:anti-sigma B factor antagonist